MATRKLKALKQEKPIRVTYVGGGAFWPGFPARDMTDPDEIARYWPAIQSMQNDAARTLYTPVFESAEAEQASEEE